MHVCLCVCMYVFMYVCLSVSLSYCRMYLQYVYSCPYKYPLYLIFICSPTISEVPAVAPTTDVVCARAAILNTHTRTVLQLYHGSTGAVMFRSGPSSALNDTAATPLPAPATAGATPYEEMEVGHRRVAWLGWDGSLKHGLEGRQDFSAWLAPELVAGLEKGTEGGARFLTAGTQHQAGYWSIRVVLNAHAEGVGGVGDSYPLTLASSTCAIISNTGAFVCFSILFFWLIFCPLSQLESRCALESLHRVSHTLTRSRVVFNEQRARFKLS